MQQDSSSSLSSLYRSLARLSYIIMFLVTNYFLGIFVQVYEHIRNEVLALIYALAHKYLIFTISAEILSLVSMIVSIPMILFVLWIFYLSFKYFFYETIKQIKID